MNVRIINNIFLGIRSYGKAFRFMFKNRLHYYIVIPAILMLLIYYLGTLLKEHQFETSAKNINGIIWYILSLLAELSIALLLMKFSKYLVVTLLSPLLAHLSQKTEFILTGNRYPFSFQVMLHDVKRAFQIVVRNLMWEYFFFLIILVVSSLGWSNPSSSPVFYLTFVIGFYYYGFSFMDYINERRELTMDESIHFTRQNRGLAITLGGFYSVMILLPVDLAVLFNFSEFSVDFWGHLGAFLWNVFLWLTAATAPIISIIASTIALNDLVDLSKNKRAETT